MESSWIQSICLWTIYSLRWLSVQLCLLLAPRVTRTSGMLISVGFMLTTHKTHTYTCGSRHRHTHIQTQRHTHPRRTDTDLQSHTETHMHIRSYIFFNRKSIESPKLTDRTEVTSLNSLRHDWDKHLIRGHGFKAHESIRFHFCGLPQTTLHPPPFILSLTEILLVPQISTGLLETWFPFHKTRRLPATHL